MREYGEASLETVEARGCRASGRRLDDEPW